MTVHRENEKYDKHTMVQIGGRLVDFVLPPLCPATGEMVDRIGMVSPAYWQSLAFIHAPFCNTCGLPFSFDGETMQCGACLDHPPVFRQARAALAYDDASRDLILRFKHGDQTHAVQAFLPWLKQAGLAMIEQADILLPVPLHPLRLIKRRYNQADLIGRALARHYPHLTYLPDGLARSRNTASQGHKKKAERENNLRNAFTIRPVHHRIFTGKTVLVIDDVFTTGATANECAKTLYRAGAKAVDVLTLARVVRS